MPPKTAAPALDSEAKSGNGLVHEDGDTLPTGVPIPVTLTRLPEDSVPPLIKTPMQGIKRPGRLFPEEKKLIRSEVRPIPDDLPTFVPGKDGVPLPQTIELQG